MKITIEQIQTFLAPKKLAIAGVSRNEKKFGYRLFKDLKEKGFEICPVNPMAKDINHIKCYASVKDIPEEFDRLIVVTPENKTLQVVKDAVDKGIRYIWIQNKSENKEILDFLSDKQVDVIFKKCVFMFAEPVIGGHKFHRTMVKFFGGYPRHAKKRNH